MLTWTKCKTKSFGYSPTLVNVRGVFEVAIRPYCQCLEILKNRYLDINVRDFGYLDMKQEIFYLKILHFWYWPAECLDYMYTSTDDINVIRQKCTQAAD